MEITLSTQAPEQQAQEWNGVVEALLPSTPAAAAWPHLASFCALHRYLSGVDVCERVAGEWAHEELLELDDAARRLSYAVVGGNMGFGRYVATMTVAEETEAAGCRIVWEFECEPVQGWSRDGLVGYLDHAVKGMAARIEEAATADE
ncbi:hypothetical protein ACQ4PT_025917 [Festuca glaucescens]